MLLKKVMEGVWKPPWCIAEHVEEIIELLNRGNYVVSHIFKEGNKLAGHLANYALDAGDFECQEFGQLDVQGRRIVNEDKLQCPYFRVKVAKNRSIWSHRVAGDRRKYWNIIFKFFGRRVCCSFFTLTSCSFLQEKVLYLCLTI